MVRKHCFRISDETAKFIGNSDLYVEKNGVLLKKDYNKLAELAQNAGYNRIVEELRIIIGLQNA